MTQRQDIIDEIADLQAQLAILNSVDEDTFTFGTVMVFASGIGGVNKSYYAKTGEEAWKSFSDGTENSLSSWILHTVQANIGYFEVYELRVQPAPFYASS